MPTHVTEGSEHSFGLVAVSDRLMQPSRLDELGLLEDDEKHVKEEVEEHDQANLVEQT